MKHKKSYHTLSTRWTMSQPSWSAVERGQANFDSSRTPLPCEVLYIHTCKSGSAAACDTYGRRQAVKITTEPRHQQQQRQPSGLVAAGRASSDGTMSSFYIEQTSAPRMLSVYWRLRARLWVCVRCENQKHCQKCPSFSLRHPVDRVELDCWPGTSI